MKHPIKVIQFGEGNFLRAFVDWMIQKMNDENVFNGSVAVVQPLENGLLPMLKEQDYAYTHFLKGMQDGQAVETYYKNDTIALGINPYEDFKGYLDLAHLEAAKIIVSNTTEAGITFDANDRIEAKADVTYPGKLTQLMYARFKAFNGAMDQGYILLPCELIDNNADHLKAAVLNYIDLWSLGSEFKTWVETANTFCNTLVDRIVPGFPRDTIETIWETLGYKDNLVVESEIFNLWVIEGDEKVQQAFPANEAGCNALFVKDVTPYKTRKVRILNGAHTTLVPVAYLYGIETVKEAVEDAVVGTYLAKALEEEIIPTLTLPKAELDAFAKEVMERFKNPYVKHYLMSIALNSMSKYETRVLPSVLRYIEANHKMPKRLLASLAAYIVFYSGHFNGMAIDANDSPDIMALYEKAWAGFNGTQDEIIRIVETVLAYEKNWSKDLTKVVANYDGLEVSLVQVVSDYVAIILNQGIKALLETLEV